MNPSLARFALAAGSFAGAIALCVSSLGTASAAARPVLAGLHQVHVGSVSPDTCGKPATFPISTSGGVFKIPSCAGTMGKVTYPSNNAPNGATVTLTSFTSNPAPSQCGSLSGETTVAYVTVTSTGSGAVTYGTTKKKSSLKNPMFPQSATFTLVAFAFGAEQFAQSLGSPNAKGVMKFPSPLNGKTIPLGLPLCFELDTP